MTSMRNLFVPCMALGLLVACGDDDTGTVDDASIPDDASTGTDASVDMNVDMQVVEDGGTEPTCGDGVTQAPEVCDGDCPTECDDGAACTMDTLTGSAAACDAQCTFTEITVCVNGDGCCPAGCDSTMDDDCSASCGNGVVEAPEICDGDCPTSCDDGMACTTDTLVGSAASCSAMCSSAPITMCANGDGCCPSGCDITSDDDCAGPVVSGVSRTTVAPGTTFAVMGLALAGATEVTIGGVAQTFVEDDATMLTVTVADATTIGTGKDVIVTTPDGSSAPVTIDVVDRLAVTGAVAVDGVTAEVTFSRAVDAATVQVADFSIAGLSVSAVSVAGTVVTLTTDTQMDGVSYTVTAAMLSDTFGNALTGTDSATFAGAAGTVSVTDFSSPILAMSHPSGTGVYGTWYDADESAFAADPVAATLEGSPAIQISDGGFTNGVYAIFGGAIPATGNYRIEVRMHVVEGDQLDGIRAYHIGAAVGTAAVHRGANPSAVPPLSIVGDYPALTAGDDTALGPVTVSTGTFAASAGDDLLIAFGTDVSSGDWNLDAGSFGTSHVVVGDVMLVRVP